MTSAFFRTIPAAVALLCAAAVGAMPLATTREDFKLPGTQPSTITDPIATPDTCAPCHANYGQPTVEPVHNWQGSMMAQAGRDPLMWAALAVSNQMVPESGETCLRCHLPKGWLEGRSFMADGSAMTADDRQGVQCGACHRLVDPVADPGNPTEDTAILAALLQPVPAFGGAMMVVDPLDRLRGPFDIITDLGSDPHLPLRSTLISPFHSEAQICGTCHNLRNPLYAKNTMTGEWELTTMDAPNADPASGFPEQSTFDEWANSTYALTGVTAPQFGGNQPLVATCQDCHMPDVSGKDANLGLTRDDVPLHTFAGANTFIPSVLPFHPAFGSEVDAAALQDGIAHSIDMLHKAATLTGTLDAGTLTVRVTNESGHKLPTGYPEGRRMWLHVRALDADRNVLLESGRYVFETATLAGHNAALMDPDYDPTLRVWEAVQGMDATVAAAVGLTAGRSQHLSLNNVRLKDNRIPPRGFTNAAFAAIDAEPIGAAYPDGQHWDEAAYPVGPDATSAEVTLYYQTASRDYIEFLRDENTTTAAGGILHDLWEQHNKSLPVEMAKLTVETDARLVAKCQKNVATRQAKYLKTYYKEWSRCFTQRVNGLTCDAARRDSRIADAAAAVRERIGGAKDRACAGRNLTSGSIGHAGTCPAPCAHLVLFDLDDLATCNLCLAGALGNEALEAAYGFTPPALPATLPFTAVACQSSLDKAAGGLADGWSKVLSKCEQANAFGKNIPPANCTADPSGGIANAKARAASKIAQCDSFAGIPGCATSGSAAAVQTCIETAVGTSVEPFLEGAYP
ncbi:MAG: hypothetical protein ACRERC_27615 [Candidatus Binatia bacterium]